MEVKKLESFKQCSFCGDQFSTALSGFDHFCCQACEKLHAFSKNEGFFESTSQQVQKLQNQYAHYDQPEVRRLYENSTATSQDLKNFTLFLEGLQCSSCVHLIEKLPEFDPNIKSAHVHFSTSLLQIEVKKEASLSRVLSLIKELGYEPHLIKQGEQLVDRYKKENREDLIRIAVAGACMGNIMLFVIPVYSGLSGSLGVIFNWLSALLFLPILFYSALPFYKSAWNSLLYRHLSIDLPITVALWAGFLVSFYNLIQGRFEIYFDSTAGFMFLILISRFMLKKIQQNYLTEPQLKDFLKEEFVLKRKSAGEFVKTPIENLSSGDVVLLKKNQIFPADGELLSESAYIDLSLLNGESLPQLNHRSMKIYAGTRLCSEEAEIRVNKTGYQTQIGSLISLLSKNSFTKTPFASLTDRLAQGLILLVFAVAILFFILYYSISPNEAVNRALALIVLACPCALAFGTPLAQGLSMKKAKTLGIIIKSPHVFEKIIRSENLFFDKTGTLTEGKLELLQNFPHPLSQEIKSLILGLEAESEHPIAQSLRSLWSDVKPTPFEQRKEILNLGVEGIYNNDFYELKTSSSQDDRSLIQIEFSKNSQKLAYLYFTDRVREESQSLVRDLQKKLKTIMILSGDKSMHVQEVALKCGIMKDFALSHQSPEDKANIVSQYPHSIMIGDGANDALALQKADVGIAMKGSVELSLAHADVYFTKGGLTPLIQLMKLSHTAQRTIQTNIAISLLYNSIGGALALMGFVSPWLAAVLMPISTGLLLISTLWGLK